MLITANPRHFLTLDYQTNTGKIHSLYVQRNGVYGVKDPGRLTARINVVSGTALCFTARDAFHNSKPNKKDPLVALCFVGVEKELLIDPKEEESFEEYIKRFESSIEEILELLNIRIVPFDQLKKTTEEQYIKGIEPEVYNYGHLE